MAERLIDRQNPVHKSAKKVKDSGLVLRMGHFFVIFCQEFGFTLPCASSMNGVEMENNGNVTTGGDSS